jgi:hypothetical protein
MRDDRTLAQRVAGQTPSLQVVERASQGTPRENFKQMSKLETEDR